MSSGHAGPIITHGRARTLASLWSVDPDSPLALFAVTGEISAQLVRAVRDDLRRLDAAAALGGGAVRPSDLRGQLRALVDYLVTHGERGPVTGWGMFPDGRLWDEDSGYTTPAPPSRAAVEDATTQPRYDPAWDAD